MTHPRNADRHRLGARYVARTRRNRQSKTGQRRITRGPLSCTDHMTCTDDKADRT